MNPPGLTNVERRGKDTYADLQVRRAWIREQRLIPVELPAGRTIQVKLHPNMTAGALLRFQGQAPDGQGDLYLRLCITADEGNLSTPVESAADRERRKRRNGRVLVSLWAIGGGLILVFSPEYKGWRISVVPASWVGYFLIAIGVLGLLGVNLFRGGPYDKRLDQPGTRPPDIG
jgi:hypothetical protein